MPTYQYVCTQCGEPLEAVQSFSDPALTDCPACAGRLRKVFSSVGVVFKGSGFYRTDSRSGASTGASSKESKDSADSKSTKESTTSSSSSSGTSSDSSSSGTSTTTTSSSGSSSSSSGSSSSTAAAAS